MPWLRILSPRSSFRFSSSRMSYPVHHGLPHSSLRHAATIMEIILTLFKSLPCASFHSSFRPFPPETCPSSNDPPRFDMFFHRKRLQKFKKFNWCTDRTLTTPTTIFPLRPQFVANHGLQCLLHSVLRKVVTGVFSQPSKATACI